jgi:ABC-type glycerol-3-phosphate transport system substrate-binding protein
MRRVILLAGLLGLAGCTPAADTALLQALAQDRNPVCVDLTFTTPWGTEHVQINRLSGCGPAITAPVARP